MSRNFWIGFALGPGRGSHRGLLGWSHNDVRTFTFDRVEVL